MTLRYLATGSRRHHGLRITQVISTFLLTLFLVGSAAAIEKLTICHGNVATAQISLAKLLGYFAAEGLDVEVRLYPSGFQSLQAMFKGECALSAAAVPPVTYQSLRREDFRILATLSSNNKDDRIIVRRDRGIRSPADLRGRSVAVPEGTSAHYLLDTYLAANGVASSEVTKHYLPAREVAKAFQNGEVDAAAIWHPYLLTLATEFGTRAEILTMPALVVSPFLLLVRNDYLQKRPAVVKSVLHALIKADNFARVQPGKAKAMLAPHFSLNAQELDTIWALHEFKVSLNQPLLFMLESVARWQIKQMPPEQQPQLPNFLEYVYPAVLKAVKPGAVSIIE